jgi:hypothetical protein
VEALGAFHCRGAARDTFWIAELTDSLAKRNRRAAWGASNAPGEDVATSRDILPPQSHDPPQPLKVPRAERLLNPRQRP